MENTNMELQKEHLQLYLGEAIAYHSKFEPSEKKELLDFVLGADKYQLMTMVMDGIVIAPPKTESDRLLIEQRFVSEQHYRKAIMSYVGASAGPFWLAYRVVRAFMDKCSAKCGVLRLNFLQRQHCIARCKVEYYKKLIAAAKSVNCKGDSTCEARKKGEVAKFEKKLSTFGARETELKKKREEASFELA
jgi:hypothetical protein